MNPSLTMNNGRLIPQVGLGVWQAKRGDEAEQAITEALRIGYRHIDTAQIYGNEESVDRAIAASGIPREEIFVTTKLWNDNQSPDRARKSFAESLRKLNMDYVDLFLLHFPVTQTRLQAWRTMEEFYRDGQARSIGVSNFTISHLEELLSHSEVRPVLNQVEFHPFLNQTALREFCQNHDILLEAYSPLIHGDRLDDERFSFIAKKHGKTTAQVLIRWNIQLGNVVIPKSVNPLRIAENFDVFDFSLDDEDMGVLNNLNEDFRTCWDPSDVA